MKYGSAPLDFQSIDMSIENFLKDIPRNLLVYLKKSFEEYLPNLMNGSFKLESRLVIDSSSVISNLINFVKYGDSTLNKIIDDPFLHLYAPTDLEREVEKNLVKISKDRKLDYKLLRKNWREKILPNIKLESPSNSTALQLGNSLVGKRDVSDVPFVALNFQLGAHGVITMDKDIIEQSVIKTWGMRGVKTLITDFRKGSFSFYIFSKALPSLLKTMFHIGIAILRVMLEILGSVIQFFSNLAASGIEALSKLPDWGKILLALGGIAIGVLVALNEEAREIIAKTVGRISEAISRFATEFYKVMKEFLDKITPLVQITLTTLSCLYVNYQKALEQLSTLAILSES